MNAAGGVDPACVGDQCEHGLCPCGKVRSSPAVFTHDGRYEGEEDEREGERERERVGDAYVWYVVCNRVTLRSLCLSVSVSLSLSLSLCLSFSACVCLFLTLFPHRSKTQLLDIATVKSLYDACPKGSLPEQARSCSVCLSVSVSVCTCV